MPSTFMPEKELNMLKVLRVGEEIKKPPHSYFSNPNCYPLTSSVNLPYYTFLQLSIWLPHALLPDPTLSERQSRKKSENSNKTLSSFE